MFAGKSPPTETLPAETLPTETLPAGLAGLAASKKQHGPGADPPLSTGQSMVSGA